MEEYRTKYKGELLRLAIQCGNTDYEALGKFIKIISKRIDEAYDEGRAVGTMEQRWRPNDER